MLLSYPSLQAVHVAVAELYTLQFTIGLG